VGRRAGGPVLGQVSAPMENSLAGVSSADVSCSGYGAPVLEITSMPGVDERGRYAYWFGAGFIRHDGAGIPLRGLGLMQVGESGWTSAHHLDNIRCSPANLAGYFAASLRPNTFLLHVGANQTPVEASSLNAGEAFVYRASCAAIMQRFTDAAIAAGAQGPIRWLLVNPYPLGWPEVNAAARATALMDLARVDPVNRAFVDLSQLAARRGGRNTSWYTTDGSHPSADGAAYLAGLIWSQLAAAV
jgi:lysophospholipase L1-like esterase